MSDQFQVSERITRFSLGLRGISALTGAGFGGVGNGRQWLFNGPNEPRENTNYPGTVWQGISVDSYHHNGVDYFRVSSVILGADGNDIYGGGRFLTPFPDLPSGRVWYHQNSAAARIVDSNIVLIGLQRESGIDTMYVTGYYRPVGQYAPDDDGLYDEATNPTGWRQINLTEIDAPWSINSASTPGAWHPAIAKYVCFQQIRFSSDDRTSNYRAIELTISEDEDTTYHVTATVAREWELDAQHTIEVHNERVTPLHDSFGPGFDEINASPGGTGTLSWYDEGSHDESGVRGELIDVYYDSNGAIQGVILQSTYSLAYQYSRSVTRDIVDSHYTGGGYASQFTRSEQSDITLLVGDTLSIPWGSYTAIYTPFTDDGTFCYGPDEVVHSRYATAVFSTQTVTSSYMRRQMQFADYRKGIILYMEGNLDSVRTTTVDGVQNPNNAPGCAPPSGGVTTNRSLATEIHWGLYRGFQEFVPRTKLAEDTFAYNEDFTSGAAAGFTAMFNVYFIPGTSNSINDSGPYGPQPGSIDPISVIPWEYSDTEIIAEYGGHPGGYSENMFPWDPAWYADSDGRGNLLYSARLTSFLQSEEVATDPMIVDHTIAVFGGELFDPIALLPDGVTLDNEQYLPQLTYIHAFSR